MQLTNQDLDKIKNLAKQWGKIISEEAFGEAGPGLDVSFSDMEKVWAAAAEGLAEGTATEALTRQAEQISTSEHCPKCGTDCSTTSQERTLQALNGKATWQEPKGYCHKCRCSFFPPAGAVEN